MNLASKLNPFAAMASGSPEPSGSPPPELLSLIAKMGAAKGSPPKGPGSGGVRGPEKPSIARDNAITRRLGGKPSRGPELKGL